MVPIHGHRQDGTNYDEKRLEGLSILPILFISAGSVVRPNRRLNIS